MEMKLKELFSENQQGSKIDSKEKNSPSGVVLDVPYPNWGYANCSIILIGATSLVAQH